ncbi:MAG TPA: fluoride efflux transporter CrcB [Kofleriaceae bacterium]|jgi:CrcB protein|nr:fluoride efflux transporter CrcB [Kofleriaceae bacterium]
MQRFLIVCLGGAVGSGTRYLVGLWAGEKLGTSFPYGTLFVNLAGCLAIAFVLEMAVHVTSFPPNLRVGLTSGFMGGLTTYSSFNYETTSAFQRGDSKTALAYLAVTLVGCALAGLLGYTIARRIWA